MAQIEEISTGWTKNGSGSDATFDAKLWMNWKKAAKNYVNSVDSTMYIGISNEAGDKWEGNKLKYGTASNGNPNVTMSYKDFEGALPEKLSESDYGSGNYVVLLEESGLTMSPNITPPAGFWNFDSATSANTDTNYWLGLTRSSPGAADIVTGATRSMKLQLDYNNKGTDVPIY